MRLLSCAPSYYHYLYSPAMNPNLVDVLHVTRKKMLRKQKICVIALCLQASCIA